MKTVKGISFFILIGIVVTFTAYSIDSLLIFSYLKDNIISLLLTLLAINTATSGLIASKIQDISLQYKGLDFSPTIREMKKSLIEQIVLIVIAFTSLLIIDSTVIVFIHKGAICCSVLVSVFSYAIYILWDTGRSVFVIIDEINKLKKK